jgi:hypothetical protein
MRKSFALIATIIIIPLLAALGLFGVSMLSTDTQISVDAMRADAAFYIADAGIQYAMAKLYDDSSYRDNPTQITKNLGSGSFTVNVSKAGTVYTLSSTSTVGNMHRVITQSVVVSGGIPETFGYGLYANGDSISLTGMNDLNIDGDLAASGAINIPEYLIDGVDGNIEPNTTLPAITVDYNHYQSIADNIIEGNKVFTSGTFNGLWYVNGSVEVGWGTTINGTIVATGDISIISAGTINITPDLDKPALVSQQDIVVEKLETLNVTGLVFAEQSVTFYKADEINITGAVIAGTNISASELTSFNLIWDSSLLENLGGFTDETGGINPEVTPPK